VKEKGGNRSVVDYSERLGMCGEINCPPAGSARDGVISKAIPLASVHVPFLPPLPGRSGLLDLPGLAALS